ncbi:MAG TPA: AAC(3) family N-acetyltransferase [Gemmatimonadaceae bacterium]|nr:AAC(3) family N-acetyltransferase [Gemmatimonadaceae bacterium]
MFSRQELADGFRRLGVAPGDLIMMHASVRAVGPIAGGPDQIHLAIKDALTERGTLLMYPGVSEGYDDVGRGYFTNEQDRELLEKMPPFDALRVRAARDNGALVEFFRSYPGTLVNNHVTRFAVWGRHATYLLSKQPWDFAFGTGSALERFVELNGKILLLGCDHDTATFLHYAEHILDVPDKRIAQFKVPVLDERGERVWRDMKEVDSGSGAHPKWPERFFAAIVDDYLRRTNNVGDRVGNAPSFLIDSRGLLDFALQRMKEVAST